MIKKLILSVALIGTVAANCSSNFEGFYVAAGAGVTQGGGEWKIETTKMKLENKMGGVNPHLTLQAGYTMAVGGDFLIGAELSGVLNPGSDENIFNSKSKDIEGNTFKVDIKKQYSVLGSLRVGYQLNQSTSAFLGLAMGITKVKFKSDNIADLQIVEVKTVDKNKNVFTIKPTLTIEHNFSKEIFARLDMSMAFYKKLTYSQEVLPIADSGFQGLAGSSTHFEGKAAARDTSLTLSVGYRF